MGCHPTDIAPTKALYELCRSSRRSYASSEAARRQARKLEDVQTLDDHSAFGSMREHRDEFRFPLSTGDGHRLCPAEPPHGNAKHDVGDSRKFGAQRASSRRSHAPDVGAYGFHVVRVIATELQPVHFGHGQERLGGRRLFELPWQLGLAAAPRTEADLNRCPHPLA
jgi:ribosomal protein S12 methylthiotransferase accessory factor